MSRLDSYTYGNLAMDAAKLLLRLKNGANQKGMIEFQSSCQHMINLLIEEFPDVFPTKQDVDPIRCNNDIR